MPRYSGSVVLLVLLGFVSSTGCTVGRSHRGGSDQSDAGFVCSSDLEQTCLGDEHITCLFDSSSRSYRTERENCLAAGKVCVLGIWCVECRPGTAQCSGATTERCVEDESGPHWVPGETCNIDDRLVCRQGACVDPCMEAQSDRSYTGCEFYAVDLDNAGIDATSDASSQQYAVVVSNPSIVETEIVIELDTGAFNGPSTPVEVARRTIAPGDLEVFNLPRREVDLSSSFTPCTSDIECASASQSCFCRGGMRPTSAGAADCRCRSSANGSGINDGTHSALTSHAYRIRSTWPVIAYQFNPLDNVGVFSNDSSLLLPTSGISGTYTVIGWPQTIAHSEDPEEDFDSSSDDEDLRAFVTIVGTEASTHVAVTLGPLVRRVVGPNGMEDGAPWDRWEFDLGEFDVINLETQGFNADFTGTRIEANRPISVFTGSEASDAPRFETIRDRRCCADHLEEQLFPDAALGEHFAIGRTPTRTTALNAAFLDRTDHVADVNEPEYVRILATGPGTTRVTTTLPAPDDQVVLTQGQSVILTAHRDFLIDSEGPISVLQILASQQALGILESYPGGDPSIIAVPPREQWRQDYVFLTPGLYAFDFVTIVAPRRASILLDEKPLEEFRCQVGPTDGIERGPLDAPSELVTYRCQLSFPDVLSSPPRIEDGDQNDGFHTIRTDAPSGVSVIVTGFDRYVSHAYVVGANLKPIQG